MSGVGAHKTRGVNRARQHANPRILQRLKVANLNLDHRLHIGKGQPKLGSLAAQALADGSQIGPAGH